MDRSVRFKFCRSINSKLLRTQNITKQRAVCGRIWNYLHELQSLIILTGQLIASTANISFHFDHGSATYSELGILSVSKIKELAVFNMRYIASSVSSLILPPIVYHQDGDAQCSKSRRDHHGNLGRDVAWLVLISERQRPNDVSKAYIISAKSRLDLFTANLQKLINTTAFMVTFLV